MTAPRRPPAPTLSPLALPKANALTEALMAEGSYPSAAAVATVRRRLLQGLSDAAAVVPDPSPCLRIRAFDLVESETGGRVHRVAHPATQASAGASGAPRPPFRWTARTARRRVGLAAVRSCLTQPGLAPAEGVATVVADPESPTGLGRRGPGSCADWLASLAPGARSLVQAEATTWATSLWTALEWERFQPAPVVGAPDRWWDWRGPLRVALQGRADVRIPGPGGAHLVVLDGFPSPASRRALCFSALVDALRSDGVDTPARVIAWWPECGKAWVAPIDGDALRDCAEQVVRVARHALQRPALAGGPAFPA